MAELKPPVVSKSEISIKKPACKINANKEKYLSLKNRKNSQSIENELPSSEDILQQLWSELNQESFDARRVFMLKAQIAQLERHLLMQTDALGQRREALMTLEEVLQKLLKLCRQTISSNTKGADVIVSRTDLSNLVEHCQCARATLWKHVNHTLNDRHWNSPLRILPNRFQNQPKSSFEVENSTASTSCGAHQLGKSITASLSGEGALALLNLQRVSHLEDDLSLLYSQLVELKTWLSMGTIPAYASDKFLKGYSGALHSTTMHLEVTCRDLLELSLLIPTRSPSRCSLLTTRNTSCKGSLRQVIINPKADADVRKILTKDVKTAESRAVLEARFKALESEVALLRGENEMLSSKLNYFSRAQRGCHQLADSVIQGMAQGHVELRKSVEEELYLPLKQLLTAYDRLEKHPSPECLRVYLEECRECVPRLRVIENHICEQMQPDSHDTSPQINPKHVEVLRARMAEMLRLAAEETVPP